MPDTAPIRILIVDDHEIVRRGLSNYIEAVDGLELVAQATNGAEAVALCAEHVPDIVLMDVVLPDMSGPEATERIVAAQPVIRVIGLSSFADRTASTAMVNAGAAGYLLKTASGGDLIRAINSVFKGELVLDPAVVKKVIDRVKSQGKTRESARAQDYLSEREVEVLKLAPDNAGQDADVIFAQAGIVGEGHVEAGGQDIGGLGGPFQVAGIKFRDGPTLPLQPAGQGAGLITALVI